MKETINSLKLENENLLEIILQMQEEIDAHKAKIELCEFEKSLLNEHNELLKRNRERMVRSGTYGHNNPEYRDKTWDPNSRNHMLSVIRKQRKEVQDVKKQKKEHDNELIAIKKELKFLKNPLTAKTEWINSVTFTAP